MPLQVHQFACLSDNYGFLLRDEATGQVACVDTPDAEKTPFGHGRPFTRRQLEELVREAELEPTAWSRALYLPPLAWTSGWAEVFEQLGSRLWPQFSGLILLEAVKQTFAVKPRAPRLRAKAPVLRPVPVGPVLEPVPRFEKRRRSA